MQLINLLCQLSSQMNARRQSIACNAVCIANAFLHSHKQLHLCISELYLQATQRVVGCSRDAIKVCSDVLGEHLAPDGEALHLDLEAKSSREASIFACKQAELVLQIEFAGSGKLQFAYVFAVAFRPAHVSMLAFQLCSQRRKHSDREHTANIFTLNVVKKNCTLKSYE